MRTKDLMRNKKWWEGEVFVDEITPYNEGRQTVTLKLPSGEVITATYYCDEGDTEIDIYQIGDAYYSIRYKDGYYQCSPAKRPDNEPVPVKKDETYWQNVILGKCRTKIVEAVFSRVPIPSDEEPETEKALAEAINRWAGFCTTGELT